jgi:hypothetical protein
MLAAPARDRTFPGTRFQLGVFVALWLIGALLALFWGPAILSGLEKLWSWLETPLVRPGWVAAPGVEVMPPGVGWAGYAALLCAWLAFLLCCVGVVNFILLLASIPHRVTLTLPKRWMRRLHLDGSGEPWVSWGVGVGIVIPAVVIAKTLFT